MRILSLAHLTWLELWRQRTPWGFLVMALLLALPVLAPLGEFNVNGLPLVGKALAGQLLGFTQFVALFLAIASTSALVSGDLERGTGLLLYSKPLSRPGILLGKFLGACGFMAMAWTLWGLIAGLSLSIKFGPELFVPTVVGFVASTLASALVIAFTLFWSCLVPTQATMGLAILGWLLTSLAPRIGDVLGAMGRPGLARIFSGLGALLPIDRLSELAKQLASSEAVPPLALASLGLIGVWWLLAALVLSRRDLAAGHG